MASVTPGVGVSVVPGAGVSVTPGAGVLVGAGVDVDTLHNLVCKLSTILQLMLHKYRFRKIGLELESVLMLGLLSLLELG